MMHAHFCNKMLTLDMMHTLIIWCTHLYDAHAIWCTHFCNMMHTQYDAHMRITHDSFIYVKWCMHESCQSYAWIIHVWWFICEKWSHMTNSYVRNDVCICPWCIWHNSLFNMYMTWLTFLMYAYVRDVYDMSHFLIRAASLRHFCMMTHP